MTKRRKPAKSPQAKGWDTRRRNARVRSARSRKGWETRRANASMLAELERLAGLTRGRQPTRGAALPKSRAGWIVVYDAPIVAGQRDEDAALGPGR